MDTESHIQSLLYEYLHNEDANWKHIVMELAGISKDTNIFSKNARNGFYYLNAVVYNQMCRKCNDEKSFEWLKEFCKAWLEKKELPMFDENCWTESCK